MSRRENAAHRCPQCRMHASLCVCALVQRVETRTRLVLVVHAFEARKTTNTGRLAAACLVNHTVVVRGGAPRDRDAREAPMVFAPDVQPLILFPADDAVPIETFANAPRPVVLVVPDGNWRQASKVRNRVPGLANVPCVSLPPGARPTSYRLRTETHEGGLATLEAIARAFGVLEGPAVEEALLRPFRAMVQRTLWTRGEIDDADVEGGLPDGAVRHDPTSGLARTDLDPPRGAGRR